MKIIHAKSTFIALIAIVAALLCADKSTFANSALDQLNESITFYASFNGHAIADLSNGNGEPIKAENAPEWGDGLYGKALRDAAKALTYHTKDNIDLSRPGAAVFWIAPQNWEHKNNPTYLNFITINAGGTVFMVRRMGNKVNRESIYSWMQIGKQKGVVNRSGSTLNWEDGWHLIAVNWGSDYMELSLDGGTLHRVTAPQMPADEKGSGTFAVASGGGEDAPFLMDELIILNRPLNNDEIQSMWQSK